tara:strand:- start:57 stop:329 length:273 start_codon:yes stop_codon:yes gene_type:complete
LCFTRSFFLWPSGYILIPKKPLIRKGKNESKEFIPKPKEFVDFLEKASNQSKDKNQAKGHRLAGASHTPQTPANFVYGKKTSGTSSARKV